MLQFSAALGSAIVEKTPYLWISVDPHGVGGVVFAGPSEKSLKRMQMFFRAPDAPGLKPGAPKDWEQVLELPDRGSVRVKLPGPGRYYVTVRSQDGTKDIYRTRGPIYKDPEDDPYWYVATPVAFGAADYIAGRVPDLWAWVAVVVCVICLVVLVGFLLFLTRLKGTRKFRRPARRRAWWPNGVPETIPPYWDVENAVLLEEGGTALIYESRNAKLACNTIIKVLNPKYSEQSDSHVPLFRNEFKIMQSLADCEFLPKVYESCMIKREKGTGTERILWFEMESLSTPGWITLFDFLSKYNGKPVPINESRQIVRGVIRIVAALHAREPKVIHADLTPRNIMISTDRTRMRVIDFGIAYCESQQKYWKATTETRRGKLDFAPPEQLKLGIYKDERCQIDESADWYSVGITAYRTICGSLPFKEKARDQHENAPRSMQPLVEMGLCEKEARVIVAMFHSEPAKRAKRDQILAAFG